MKVLIAGAGIAGPATAIALRKAGITSVLYEARPEHAPDADAFVTIAANGQDALHAIDAGDAVLGASFPASRMRIFDPAGTQVAEVPLGRDHPGPRTITRSRLASVSARKPPPAASPSSTANGSPTSPVPVPESGCSSPTARTPTETSSSARTASTPQSAPLSTRPPLPPATPASSSPAATPTPPQPLPPGATT